MKLSSFITSAVLTLLTFPVITLFAAGDWLWTEGWVFGLWFDAMVLSNMVYLYRNDPALLGSIGGLLIGLIALVVLAVRIAGEEKMLIEELDGYKSYQDKVRYRLVPYIW